MKNFIDTLTITFFPTILVNIFCDKERLIIEIDKAEIFYYNIKTKEFKYNHIKGDQALYIKEIYKLYITKIVGDSNG